MDNREEMILLMEEFENSGQSQKDFSASKGIRFHKFNYWFRKLKKKTESEIPSGFVRIETAKPINTSKELLELEYPNGVKLKLTSVDLSLVCRLINLY